jgi:UDP-glucose 4-epimerase
MKILITGALGHIGSSLSTKLASFKKVKKIYLIDNLISQRYCSLYSLPESNKFKFLDLDISKCSIKDIPISDVVVHLAAKTDAAQSAKLKNEFKTNNLNATKNIVKYCQRNSSKIIFASSTSVYGPQDDTVDEDCNKSDLNPQSPYANIKLFEERLISKQLEKNSFIILRLGTIYGFSRGIIFHTAVNNFCFQASVNQPLTVWKTAFNQKRPYLSLNDFNNLIIHILNNNLPYNQIYNAVSKNMKVSEIINIIKKFKRVKLRYVNHPIMNQMSYEVKNQKLLKNNFVFKSRVIPDIKRTLYKLRNI